MRAPCRRRGLRGCARKNAWRAQNGSEVGKQLFFVAAVVEAEGLAACSARGKIDRTCLERLQTCRKTVGALLLEPQASRLAPASRRHHGLRSASPAIGNHGRAASLGFDGNNPEVLLTRKEQGPAAAEAIADNRIRLPAEKMHGRSGKRAETVGILAGTNDDQRPP